MDYDFYFLNLTFFQVILHKKFFNLDLYKANERIFLLQVQCSDYQWYDEVPSQDCLDEFVHLLWGLLPQEVLWIHRLYFTHKCQRKIIYTFYFCNQQYHIMNHKDFQQVKEL